MAKRRSRQAKVGCVCDADGANVELEMAATSIVRAAALVQSRSKTPTKWPQVCLAGLRTPRNIPEDTLCPPLISKLPNCLPGCWGPREPPPSKKQGHRGHQRAHLEARGPSTTLVEARWTPPTTPLYYSAATKVCPFSRDLPAQLHNILETPLPLESSRYREGREGFGWSKS